MGLLDYIKGFEGYAPKAQWDYKQNSVGWGTRAKYPGEVIDKDEAERRLQSEIDNARSIVDRHAPNIDPGTKAALTSLTYNAGDTWTRSGLGAAVQAGDPNAIRERFLQYTKAGGQTLPGLVKRRQQEAQWIGNTEVFDERQRTPTGGSVSDTATGLGGYGPIAADTRMALGGPPQPATPQPNGAPQMAEQKQGGFGGLLSAFANGMQSPLFMSGAAMYNAGAEGKNIGGGFLAGGQAAGQAARQQMEQTKYQREMQQQQIREKTLSDLANGPTPLWAANLPQGALKLAAALGDDGPKYIAQLLAAQPQRDLEQRRLSLAEGADKRAAALSDAQMAQAKTQTPQWRMENAEQFGIAKNTPEWRQFVVNGSVPAANSSDLVAQSQQREKIAGSLGMTPGSPAYQAFVATGKMPREDQQPLTATDKKAILEADEMVLSSTEAIKGLTLARQLSDKAYSGTLASERAAVSNMMPWNTPESQATTEMNQAIMSQALANLKAIFGAAPTEGERKILIEIQGSANQPKAVRDAIFERARALAERRLQFNKQRAEELRGGTFYGGQGGGGSWKAPGGAQQSKPADANADPLGIR